jgi:hypothetical protein
VGPSSARRGAAEERDGEREGADVEEDEEATEAEEAELKAAGESGYLVVVVPAALSTAGGACEPPTPRLLPSSGDSSRGAWAVGGLGGVD